MNEDEDKQAIYYETVGAKVRWRYTSSLQNDIEIIKLKDVWREEHCCYDIKQYINSFVDVMKEKVIRYLPNINQITIMLGVFDKNNVFQRVAIYIMEAITDYLKIERTINYYKSIFVIIKYKDKIVFIGSLSLDDIDDIDDIDD